MLQCSSGTNESFIHGTFIAENQCSLFTAYRRLCSFAAGHGPTVCIHQSVVQRRPQVRQLHWAESVDVDFGYLSSSVTCQLDAYDAKLLSIVRTRAVPLTRVAASWVKAR